LWPRTAREVAGIGDSFFIFCAKVRHAAQTGIGIAALTDTGHSSILTIPHPTF